MIRIVADTSTLYSTLQAKEAGFDVSPLSVTINGQTYREFDEISAEAFVDIIHQGHLPVSSQPAIGEVAALYEKYKEDDIINVAMADGLSGTYRSAVAASELAENPDRITVVNTRTLCGPHRYLAETAVRMARENSSVEEIVKTLQEKMDTAKSFLVPADFDYLRRGGRLSPLVSYVGQAAGLMPIMTQTEDGCRLAVASVRRGFNHTMKYVEKALQKHGVGAGWRVYITHAAAPELAQKAMEALKNAFPECVFEIYPLSPAFITHGGPGCFAMQVIKE